MNSWRYHIVLSAKYSIFHYVLIPAFSTARIISNDTAAKSIALDRLRDLEPPRPTWNSRDSYVCASRKRCVRTPTLLRAIILPLKVRCLSY